MTPEQALAAIAENAVLGKAEEMHAYHKAERVYLGTATPEIDALCKGWRAEVTLQDRLTLAQGLWQSDIHEGRIAAAKLLTQARIRPDAAAWDLICAWVPDVDAWAIADAVCIAAQKRLVADPSRLDRVEEEWTTSPLMWARRAALVATLPFARMNHPKPAETEARERALGWAERSLGDRDWFIQKAVAGWLRDLSRHDADRARKFLAEHGEAMKPWARKEAGQYLD